MIERFKNQIYLTNGYFTEKRTKATQKRGRGAISHMHSPLETILFVSISRTITLRNFYEYAKKRDGQVGFNFQKCRRRSYLQSPLTRVSRKSAPAHDSQKKPFFSISSTSLLPMIKYVARYCIIGTLFTSLFSVDHGYRVPRISGSSTLITRKFA